MKFLLLLLLVAIVWLAFKKSARRPAARPPEERPAEVMVVCAHCGVHLPESESLMAGELRYCSRSHLEAGPGRGPS